MVKSAVTTIRHLDGGRDVKVIVMMNYHYSMGLDKYLRSADFKYITTVDSSVIITSGVQRPSVLGIHVFALEDKQ